MSQAARSPDSELVLSALGQGTQDAALLARFAEASLHNWPEPDDDREGARIEEYWRYGFTLEFDDTASQERLLGVTGIQGPLAVSAVLFYAAGVGGHAGWKPGLPFDLRFDMDPPAVAALLGSPRASRTPYELRVDQFMREGYVIDVCFAPREAGIDFVSVRLKNIYEKDEAPANGMAWEPLAATLGRPIAEASVLEAISACVGAPVLGQDLAEHENTVFNVDAGLTVYTLPARDFGPAQGQGEQAPGRLISGYKFSRAGVARSRGYRGLLPFGLIFADGPDAIARKLPASAREEHYEADGRYTCELDGCFLHVHYSLIYWQILAVSIFHPSLSE